jgi:general secretion pathway protein A
MGRKFNSKGQFLIHFKNFLLRAHQSSKKVLLIIDEAQRLNHDILHEIRFLANIDFGGKILINIFLVGQNEFKAILMEDRNKSVRDRITAYCEVKPLTENEVSGYIHHRLRIAGTTRLIFTPEAVRAIYRHTRGYPRLMNILCDRALLTGFINEKKVISPAMVEEAAADLTMTIGNYRPEEHNVRRPEKAVPPRFKEQEVRPPEKAVPTQFEKQKVRRPEKAVPPRFKRPPRPNPTIPPFAAAVLIVLVGFGIYLSRDFILENFQQLKNHRIAAQIIAWIQGPDQDKTPMHKQSISASGDAFTLKKKSTVSSSAEKARSSTQAAARSDGLKTSLDISKKIGVPVTAGTSFQKGGAARPGIATTGKTTSYVINFDPNSDEISPESQEVLNRITGIFLKSPVKNITVKGYTGSFGNENYEKYMSVERAIQVKNFLVSKGIPASSLNIYGMGYEKPGGTNTTADEWQKNSRVEIEVSLIQE